MDSEKLSLDQRLRAAKDDDKPAVLPAELLFCQDYFNALSALTGSSKNLLFYFDKIDKLEQDAGRELPIFMVVAQLLKEGKMELLYQILVEPFVTLNRKEDSV